MSGGVWHTVLDLIRHLCRGHNELDEPAFTQPLMYEQIRSRKSVPTLYEEKLVVCILALPSLASLDPQSLQPLQADDVLTDTAAKSVRASYKAELEAELARAGEHVPSASMLQDQWSGMVWPASPEAVRDPQTGVAREVLEQVGRASVTVPNGFVRVFSFDRAFFAAR